MIEWLRRETRQRRQQAIYTWITVVKTGELYLLKEQAELPVLHVSYYLILPDLPCLHPHS